MVSCYAHAFVLFLGFNYHTALLFYICPDELLRTSNIEALVLGFARRHYHRWSSVVHGCRLLATEPSQSRPLVSGNERQLYVTSAASLRVSAVVSSLTFQTFSSAFEVTFVIIWHFKLACLVHLSLAGQAPHYLAEDIHLVAPGPGRQLRSSTDRSCSVPRTYSTYGDRSFAAAGTRVWNSLPSNLRDETLSFRSFRRLLKTHWFTADHIAMWTIIYCAIEIHLGTYLLLYLHLHPLWHAAITFRIPMRVSIG